MTNDHPQPLPDRVRQLGRRLEALVPDRRDPHRFHELKADLVNELRRLAADLRRERGR